MASLKIRQPWRDKAWETLSSESRRKRECEKAYLQIKPLESRKESLTTMLVKEPCQKGERDACNGCLTQAFQWEHPNKQHLHKHYTWYHPAVNLWPILPTCLILWLIDMQYLYKPQKFISAICKLVKLIFNSMRFFYRIWFPMIFEWFLCIQCPYLTVRYVLDTVKAHILCITQSNTSSNECWFGNAFLLNHSGFYNKDFTFFDTNRVWIFDGILVFKTVRVYTEEPSYFS